MVGRGQQASYPDIPAELLICFYDGEGDPSLADVEEALGCDAATAQSWLRVLRVRLIAPAWYLDLFDAEDLVTERQQQWQRHHDDVRTTAAELAAVHEAIELKLAESRLPAYEADAKEELARLDTEDARVRRKQERLPGAGRLLETALSEAHTALEQAQETLQQVRLEALAAVEEAWCQEVLAALEPVQALLTQAGWLDEAWKTLGVTPGPEHGQARLRDGPTGGKLR